MSIEIMKTEWTHYMDRYGRVGEIRRLDPFINKEFLQQLKTNIDHTKQ